MTYQKTVTVHAAHDGLAFEDALGVLLVEGEQHTGSVAQLVERELHAPELALVAETELADSLQLIVETLLLERTTRLLEGLGVCGTAGAGRPGSVVRRGKSAMRQKTLRKPRPREGRMREWSAARRSRPRGRRGRVRTATVVRGRRHLSGRYVRRRVSKGRADAFVQRPCADRGCEEKFGCLFTVFCD